MMTPSDNNHVPNLTHDSVLQNLTFPLNIYARLVHADEGSVFALGYGCQPFGDNSSLADAQQNMLDELLAAVSVAPPARVLDVGCGTGALARRLAAAAYQVTGIDNNAAAITLARTADTGQSRVEWVEAGLEEFEAAEPFDLIVLQNSFRYLSPLITFNRLQRLLAPGGQLLIFDEFVIDTAAVAPEPLSVLKHVMALALRLGFTVSGTKDLSAHVAPFMTRLLGLLQKSAEPPGTVPGLAPEALQGLTDALAADIRKCEHGRLGHVLIDLRAPVSNDAVMQPLTELLPAELLPVDSYRTLFEKSFDTPFDPALWQWKYGEGRGHSVVARQDGQAVAHYGGIGRDIVYFGQQNRGVQICDVMVLPERRGFFSKKGLFFKTAASMLELYAGNTAPHLLGFGFPNLKAMHVAQRLGLYQQTDELRELSYTPDDTDAADTLEVVEHDLGEAITLDADALWERMRADMSGTIIGVRDSQYLRYRYQQRPGLIYRCFRLCSADQTLALAFVREHGAGYLVMDLLAERAMLAPALRRLCSAGHALQRPMVFWLTAGQLPLVTTSAITVTDTGIKIPCNAWSDGPSQQHLSGAWWLTAGDMDFL